MSLLIKLDQINLFDMSYKINYCRNLLFPLSILQTVCYISIDRESLVQV